MNFTARIFTTLSPLVLGLAVSVAHADWTLDNDQSHLSFVSIKKDSIAEAHTFDNLTGTVKDDGSFSVEVDLGSVKTKIDIRDQRMKEHLFEVDNYPTAMISGTLPKDVLKSLKKGKAVPITTDITIDLHGKKVTKPVLLKATKLNRKTVHVDTLEPIFINASEFGLEPGIAKLKELAMLPNIALAVPVTVDLIFQK